MTQARRPRNGKCPDCGAKVERSEVDKRPDGFSVTLWPCRHTWFVSGQNEDYLDA